MLKANGLKANGLTVRQIERLAGINRNIVKKLKRKKVNENCPLLTPDKRIC